ncbi:hypothetical protein CEXT_248321 [Caerostris extrusa]|uniref:Uncharacterized protein n=1 Tax=Caerostris extrusa TaxID=172846 RepID=A0AAV4XIX3_CAEEX|nr:hypothetical protein CEXT_248321 [Caerostris extrusa]
MPRRNACISYQKKRISTGLSTSRAAQKNAFPRSNEQQNSIIPDQYQLGKFKIICFIGRISDFSYEEKKKSKEEFGVGGQLPTLTNPPEVPLLLLVDRERERENPRVGDIWLLEGKRSLFVELGKQMSSGIRRLSLVDSS